MQRLALGEKVNIGDLYDGTSETFCGFSMLRSKPKIETKHYYSATTRIQSSNQHSEISTGNDVNADLSVSILSGLVSLSGNYQHLYDNSKSSKLVTASLLHAAATKTERIDIYNADVRSLINVDTLRNCTNATHVLVAIEWGANTIVTLKSSSDSKLENAEIQGKLKGTIMAIEKSVSVEGNVNDTNSLFSQDRKHELYFHSDVSGIDPSPTTITEARDAIKKIESLIKKNGKVIPLRFTLKALSELNIDGINLDNRLVLPVDILLLHRIETLFSDINEAKKILTDVESTFDQNDFCIPTDIKDDLLLKIRSVGFTEVSIKQQISNGLKDARSGRMTMFDFKALSESAINNNPLKTHQSFVKGLSHVYDRIEFISNAIKNKAVYIGKSSSSNKTVRPGKYYMFFYNSSPRSYVISEHEKYFNKLMDGKTACFIADIDLCPNLSKFEGVPPGLRICYYKKNRYIDDDVYENSKKPLMVASKITHCDNKPDKRVLLQLVCPASIEHGKCQKKDKHFWFCEKCKASVEYGFDDMFYCKCGRAPYDSYKYRCSDSNHIKFVKFTKNDILAAKLKKLRLNPCVNILFLGESGTGKSTMINAMANYIKFDDFSCAEKAKDIVCFVPTQITHSTLENHLWVHHSIPLLSSESDDECREVGQSATLHPKSYALQFEHIRYRFIDTPGVGDTKGPAQDAINVENILKFISSIDELHGICIVLKPDNSRRHDRFEYCLQDILMRLHKNSVNNMIFCFTHAKQSGGNDSMATLETFLNSVNKQLKKTSHSEDSSEIILSDHSNYFMDNIAFKQICIRRNGGKHDSFEDYSAIWNHSTEETSRMLKHIGSKDPHNTSDTMSVNKARNIIFNLAKPMAKISENIDENIKLINEYTEHINELEAANIKLEEDRFDKRIIVVSEPIDYPKTVCTSKKCVERQKITGTNSYYHKYSAVCHSRCYLNGVAEDTVGAAPLQTCSSMVNNVCKECGCSWEKHMHVTYDIVKKLIKVKNPQVEETINNNVSDQEVKIALLTKHQLEIQQLQKERNDILEIGSKFASFLKQEALLSKNDAFEKHVEMLLQQDLPDASKESLRDLLRDYQEKKRCLDEFLENKKENILVNQIDELRTQLINLAKTGKSFKDFFETANAMQLKFFEDLEYRFKQPQINNNNDNQQAPVKSVKSSLLNCFIYKS